MEEATSICLICKMKVEETPNIVYCTTCDQAYHLDHLKKWLINNNKCPNCKQVFPFELMAKMRPGGNNFKAKQKSQDLMTKAFTSSSRSTRRRIEEEEEGPVSDNETVLAKLGMGIALMFFFIIVFGAF